MNALLEMGGSEFPELPEESCRQDKMNEYLETQADSITQRDKITPPIKHTNPFIPLQSTSTPKTTNPNTMINRPINIKGEHLTCLMDSPMESSYTIPPPLIPSQVLSHIDSNVTQLHSKRNCKEPNQPHAKPTQLKSELDVKLSKIKPEPDIELSQTKPETDVKQPRIKTEPESGYYFDPFTPTFVQQTKPEFSIP